MIKVFFKDVTKSEALKEYAEKKINEFLQEIEGEDSEVKVVFRKERKVFVVEITIYMKKQIFRVEQSGDDLYVLMNKSIDVLLGKYRKFKTKIEKKRRDRREFKNIVNDINMEKEDEGFFYRLKTLKPEKMDVNGAIESMELLGHTFYIFRDMNDRISVLYKQNEAKHGENSYGVIIIEG